MVKEKSRGYIEEIIGEFKRQGVLVNAEEAAPILDFLYLAAAILISDKKPNENS